MRNIDDTLNSGYIKQRAENTLLSVRTSSTEVIILTVMKKPEGGIKYLMMKKI